MSTKETWESAQSAEQTLPQEMLVIPTGAEEPAAPSLFGKTTQTKNTRDSTQNHR